MVFLSSIERYPPWFGVPMVAPLVALTSLCALSMIKLIGRINQLKRT